MADLNTDREPDGYLMADCPESGLVKPLAYWLPATVDANALGLGVTDPHTGVTMRCVILDDDGEGIFELTDLPRQLEFIKFQVHSDPKIYDALVNELIDEFEADDVDRAGCHAPDGAKRWASEGATKGDGK